MALIKENIRKSFWFNLLIVLLLCLILYIMFFLTLSWVTKHGQEVKIPDLRGKDINTAKDLLKQMHFEVALDSTYEPLAQPMSVLKQVPDTGSMVKTGRTVFLTFNMVVPPRVPMPNLVGLTYRSAEMLLKNNKLFVGDTALVPDIASGAIKEQHFKGSTINPGDLIPQGSKIGLVIGNGLGNTEHDVPNVVGMSVEMAITVLNQYNLQALPFPRNELTQISDTGSAIVVDQAPKATGDDGQTVRIKEGDLIELYIEQYPTDSDPKTDNTNKGKNVKDNQ